MDISSDKQVGWLPLFYGVSILFWSFSNLIFWDTNQFSNLDHTRPDQAIVNQKKKTKKKKKKKEKNKENLLNRELCCPGRPQSKMKRKRKEIKYTNLAKELKKKKKKKPMRHERDSDTNCNWYVRNNLQMTGTGTIDRYYSYMVNSRTDEVLQPSWGN